MNIPNANKYRQTNRQHSTSNRNAGQPDPHSWMSTLFDKTQNAHVQPRQEDSIDLKSTSSFIGWALLTIILGLLFIPKLIIGGIILIIVLCFLLS